MDLCRGCFRTRAQVLPLPCSRFQSIHSCTHVPPKLHLRDACSGGPPAVRKEFRCTEIQAISSAREYQVLFLLWQQNPYCQHSLIFQLPSPYSGGVSKIRHKRLRAKLTGVRGSAWCRHSGDGRFKACGNSLPTASIFPLKAGLWIQSVTRGCYPCLGYTRRKCTWGDLLIDTHLVRREKRYNPKCLEPSLSTQTSAHCSRITFELLQSLQPVKN